MHTSFHTLQTRGCALFAKELDAIAAENPALRFRVTHAKHIWQQPFGSVGGRDNDAD